MSKIKRIVASKTKITSATANSSILGTFTGKCCDAAVFNNNDMKLNRQLFENLFASDEYKDAIDHGYYIGFLGHPEDPGCQDFEHACIVMKECHITDDDEIEGTFDLIDTPVGRIAKSFIDAGVHWGISIRGAGDVDAEGNVDPDTFVFRGFDLVAFPAYNDAVPEFQQIAASKNLDDQVKYKRVCAAIDKNLDKVDDISTIEAMQKQFNPDSEEYKKLEARKADIGVEDDSCPECSEEDKQEIMGKKLRCMTDMYLEEHSKNIKLSRQLDEVENNYNRHLNSIKRINASQNKLMTTKLDKINASYKLEVSKNHKLESKLKSTESKLNEIIASKSKIVKEFTKIQDDNLLYKQKVESSSTDIKDKDAKISELQAKLNKTVISNTQVAKEASNRDEQIAQLKSKISASTKEINGLNDRIRAIEATLQEYQQAYADIYANAIGIHISDLPITSFTSVQEMENLIQGATNTANVPAAPSFEDSFEDVETLDNIDVNDDGLVTL